MQLLEFLNLAIQAMVYPALHNIIYQMSVKNKSIRFK